MQFVEQNQGESPGPPSPPETEKEKIAELAEAELQRCPYLALRNVTCAAQDGTLILSGQLPTYHLKQMAQATVAALPGVKHIDNRIAVTQPLS